ncbi:MAG: hypothetical protein JRI68_14225 [Deltaproteobacteria bacterium]|nr:hypothetical protein [Deltaproteobacteria bacterium]
MSTFTRVVWPVCVAATLVLSGCVVDTSESEDIDEERTGEVYLELDGTSGEGEDDEGDNQRDTLDDGTSTETEEGALAVPHAEPDPEPWDPGDGHDDT